MNLQIEVIIHNVLKTPFLSSGFSISVIASFFYQNGDFGPSKLNLAQFSFGR